MTVSQIMLLPVKLPLNRRQQSIPPAHNDKENRKEITSLLNFKFLSIL